MFRLLVSGSRHFADYDFLAGRLDALLANRLPNVTLLHGAARGVDLLADRYADDRELSKEVYPADWSGKGRAAGPIRNEEMVRALVAANRPCAAVAFRANHSRGTTDCIARCQKARLVLVVYDVVLDQQGRVVSHAERSYSRA